MLSYPITSFLPAVYKEARIKAHFVILRDDDGRVAGDGAETRIEGAAQ